MNNYDVDVEALPSSMFTILSYNIQIAAIYLNYCCLKPRTL